MGRVFRWRAVPLAAVIPAPVPGAGRGAWSGWASRRRGGVNQTGAAAPPGRRAMTDGDLAPGAGRVLRSCGHRCGACLADLVLAQPVVDQVSNLRRVLLGFPDHRGALMNPQLALQAQPPAGHGRRSSSRADSGPGRRRIGASGATHRASTVSVGQPIVLRAALRRQRRRRSREGGPVPDPSAQLISTASAGILLAWCGSRQGGRTSALSAANPWLQAIGLRSRAPGCASGRPRRPLCPSTPTPVQSSCAWRPLTMKSWSSPISSATPLYG
jgi:hypothetical protein